MAAKEPGPDMLQLLMTISGLNKEDSAQEEQQPSHQDDNLGAIIQHQQHVNHPQPVSNMRLVQPVLSGNGNSNTAGTSGTAPPLPIQQQVISTSKMVTKPNGQQTPVRQAMRVVGTAGAPRVQLQNNPVGVRYAPINGNLPVGPVIRHVRPTTPGPTIRHVRPNTPGPMTRPVGPRTPGAMLRPVARQMIRSSTQASRVMNTTANGQQFPTTPAASGPQMIRQSSTASLRRQPIETPIHTIRPTTPGQQIRPANVQVRASGGQVTTAPRGQVTTVPRMQVTTTPRIQIISAGQQLQRQPGTPTANRPVLTTTANGKQFQVLQPVTTTASKSVQLTTTDSGHKVLTLGNGQRVKFLPTVNGGGQQVMPSSNRPQLIRTTCAQQLITTASGLQLQQKSINTGPTKIYKVASSPAIASTSLQNLQHVSRSNSSSPMTIAWDPASTSSPISHQQISNLHSQTLNSQAGITRAPVTAVRVQQATTSRSNSPNVIIQPDGTFRIIPQNTGMTPQQLIQTNTTTSRSNSPAPLIITPKGPQVFFQQQQQARQLSSNSLLTISGGLHTQGQNIQQFSASSSLQPHVLSTLSRTASTDALQHSLLRRNNELETNERENDPDDVMEDESEELGHAETYNVYKPPKLDIGVGHPDEVVETNSLASVSPPDITYQLNLPDETISKGKLSSLQLESICYAGQTFENFLPTGHRAGYFIGDGAGVGKGRTVAGVIADSYNKGNKRALWISNSADLKVDAERDLSDIGASNIKVHALNKLKYGKLNSGHGKIKNGVIFSTYSSLVAESNSDGKYQTRLSQLIQWLGKQFDGVIIFDECHKAKNLTPSGSSKPTKTAMNVLKLQNSLPKSRIVYASATGASEVRHMAYMVRLGLWGEGTSFKDFDSFCREMERRGVGAMEMVAIELKQRGQYIARQLSFKGVSFRIEEVQITAKKAEKYNAAVEIYGDLYQNIQYFSETLDQDPQQKKIMYGQFFSTQQRFFKYMTMSTKVNKVVEISLDEVKGGNCVVIGLQSTGEAQTKEANEESGGLEFFYSSAKGTLKSFVEKFWPKPQNDQLSFLGLVNDIDRASGSKKRKANRSGNKDTKRTKNWYDEDDSDEDEDSDAGSTASEEDYATMVARKMKEFEEISSDSSDSSDDSSEEEMNSEEEDYYYGSASLDVREPRLRERARQKVAKRKKKKLEAKKKEVEEEVRQIIASRPPKKSKKKKQPQPSSSSRKEESSSEEDYENFDDFADKYIEAKGLKISDKDRYGPKNTVKATRDLSTSVIEQSIQAKTEMLKRIDKLDLPTNTIDEIIDKLGGPDNVSEMTGRKGRIITKDDGDIGYVMRTEDGVNAENMNLKEKERFMNGDKLIAIISEAASSGISLQADKRVKNQRRRVHITLELPWSADRAIQQFGRTHRSNQVSAPEYILMISSLAGEMRFASTCSKRMESMGALTHGDRRATEVRDLSRFNIDNKFGRVALDDVLRSILIDREGRPNPVEYDGDFWTDVRHGLINTGLIKWNEDTQTASLEKDHTNMGKFLNRLLAMPVNVQNALWKYFDQTMTARILEAKKNGHFDLGIQDLGKHGEAVTKKMTKKFTGTFSSSRETCVHLSTMEVERGMSWEEAMNTFLDHSTKKEEGFYIGEKQRSGNRLICLIAEISNKKGKQRLFHIYKPHCGLQTKAVTMEEIRKRYKRIVADDAAVHWEKQYFASKDMCCHKYWRGSCRTFDCKVGLRSRTYYVLHGSVLSVWDKLEQVLSHSQNSRLQTIRLKTTDEEKIVGTLIPPSAVSQLCALLESSATSCNQIEGAMVNRDELAAARREANLKARAANAAASGHGGLHVSQSSPALLGGSNVSTSNRSVDSPPMEVEPSESSTYSYKNLPSQLTPLGTAKTMTPRQKILSRQFNTPNPGSLLTKGPSPTNTSSSSSGVLNESDLNVQHELIDLTDKEEIMDVTPTPTLLAANQEAQPQEQEAPPEQPILLSMPTFDDF